MFIHKPRQDHHPRRFAVNDTQYDRKAMPAFHIGCQKCTCFSVYRET